MKAIGLIFVTCIVVLSVAFLMWGYFTNRAIIEEQGNTIAEQGIRIEEQQDTITKQGIRIEEQKKAIIELGVTIAAHREAIEEVSGIMEDLGDNIQLLQSANLELKAKVNALQAEWERLEALGGYREFRSVWELERWLSHDPTSENEFIPESYDCDDFAMDLTLAAIRDGRWIGLFSTEGHLKNFTVIGDSIHEIEPQTDKVSFWGYVD